MSLLADLWQLPPSSPFSAWHDVDPVQVGLLGPTVPVERLQTDDPWSRTRYPLLRFVEEAWHLIEPTPFIPGWHVEAECRHLEAIANGVIKRLLVNVPMRSGKSNLVSVLFHPWVWITAPASKFLCTSYSKELALRDSVRSRTLIQSRWYRERWGDRFRLQGDINVKSRYANSKGGYRVTVPIGGATGDGGDFLLCVPADQRILTEDGWIPIGDIVENRLQSRVATLDVESGVVTWQPIHTYMKRRVEGGAAGTKATILYEVKTASGLRLIVTGNHPVFTVECGYVPAADLYDGVEHVLQIGKPTPRSWFSNPPPTVQSDRILSVCPIMAATDVYNLAVATHNNYFAEGILVHNCDDLHSRNEDNSPSRADITTAVEFFNGDFAGSLNNPRESCIIVSGQRVSIDDVSASILAKGGYCHLKIRQEYVPPPPGEPKPVTAIGWSDPRTEPGELMHPARWGREQVDEAKRRGMRPYLAHHQQDPEGSGGILFQDAWWQVYTEWLEVSVFRKVIHSWDFRFKDEKESGSFVCGQCWGLSPNGLNAYLLDEVRGRWGYVDTKQAFVGFCKKWPSARLKLIENKANGPAVYSDFRALTFGLLLVDPEGGKLARAEKHTSSAEAGHVWLPSETLAPWIAEWRIEASHYPSPPNDRLDAATQAWDYLLPPQLADDPRTEERKKEARRRQLMKRVEQQQRVVVSRTRV